MIIDFHIHTFPDALAERAVKKLSETAKIPSYTDGTVTDTLRKMKQWKVDKGVFLNIATKPSQQRTINDRCLSMNDPRIIPFGSVHIDSEDRLEELERVKKLGMKGIKLHPDYQGFFFDDPRAYPVYERCADLGLIVVIHAGSDPVSPGVIHADPQAIARVLDRFPRLILVAAHFGGTDCWGDVLRHLVGKQVYLDTALSAGNIPADTARQIIRAHGAHRILFGSDCPWHSSAMDAEFIRSLGLSEQEEEQIFYQNACALLGREQI